MAVKELDVIEGELYSQKNRLTETLKESRYTPTGSQNMAKKKTLDFKKIEKQKERRTNMYVWRDLNHLKDAFAEFISDSEIDDIVKLIKKLGKYEERAGVSAEENESGLCNLVEAMVMHRLVKRDYKIIGQDNNTRVDLFPSP